jgi:hypothetical protein
MAHFIFPHSLGALSVQYTLADGIVPDGRLSMPTDTMMVLKQKDKATGTHARNAERSGFCESQIASSVLFHGQP